MNAHGSAQTKHGIGSVSLSVLPWPKPFSSLPCGKVQTCSATTGTEMEHAFQLLAHRLFAQILIYTLMVNDSYT
jgi:hypothetical protein